MLTRTRLLDKVSLAEQAYRHLLIHILDQVIRPDDAIGIDDVAAALGVSQTPIREALARLEGDRLVVRLRNGRYQAAAAMSTQDYAHLFQTRLLLEPAAAALAARCRTADTVTILQQSIKKITAAGRGSRSQTFVNFVDADAMFHQSVARGCGNMFLATALAQLQANHRISPFYRDRGVVDAEAVIREHIAIFEAIEAGDASRAEEAMRRHVERARDVVLGWLQNRAISEPGSATA